MCGDEVYANFRDLIVAENNIECESFAVVSIDSLLVYNLQILLTSIFRQLCL